MRMVRIVAVWALQILVGSMFVLLGVMKFRDPSWVRNFARWGYPDGFYMVVGVLEVVGGIAVLIPPLASYGALLLIGVMTGAALTHLVHGEMQRFMAPVVYLLFSGGVAWVRRRSAWRSRRVPARPPAVI
jgi:putative oxidoreductase